MPFQYVLDSIGRNDVAEIGESTLDSIVTPGGILSCHAEYQIGNLLRYAGPTWSLPGKGPFLAKVHFSAISF